MRIKETLLLAGVIIALQSPHDADAQGKGGGKGHGGGNPAAQGKGKGPEKTHGPDETRGRGPGQAAGKGAAKSAGKGSGVGAASNSSATAPGKNRGAHPRFTRPVSASSMPAAVRKYASSRRPGEIIAAAAVAHAFARGRENDVRIEEAGDRVRLVNRNGDPLLLIDDRAAENLGRWRVGVLDDEVRGGAPSFCRSGAGHPVFGREWCIDKGFGLGADGDFRWARTSDVGDIIYRRGTLGDRIVGAALENLLGTTAFNRLALHAVTLGLLDPLVGTFVGEPAGQQYLVVNSGTYPVAELYDTNRDSRWDNLLVALRPW
jgi:hypothetical protein